MSILQLIDSLCVPSASLRETRWKHGRESGDLDPGAFMGVVLRRCGMCAAALPGVQRGELADILWTLERGMGTGDRAVREVISTGFLGAGRLEPFFGAIAPMLGPEMRARLHQVAAHDVRSQREGRISMTLLCTACHDFPKNIDGHPELRVYSMSATHVIFRCRQCERAWNRSYSSTGAYSWEATSMVAALRLTSVVVPASKDGGTPAVPAMYPGRQWLSFLRSGPHPRPIPDAPLERIVPTPLGPRPRARLCVVKPPHSPTSPVGPA